MRLCARPLDCNNGHRTPLNFSAVFVLAVASSPSRYDVHQLMAIPFAAII